MSESYPDEIKAAKADERRIAKWRRELMAELDDLHNLEEDELKSLISTSAQNIVETERARDADEDLMRKREAAKLAAAPYGDAIKRQKAKIGYAHYLLETMGKA